MNEDTMDGAGAVYVQTNAPTNGVVAYRRGADGDLTSIGTYPTGGAGDDVPHLTSQGSLILTGDRRHLLVANAGSSDVSVFAVQSDGGLELAKMVPVGPAPKSITERDGLVFVLSTGDASIAGFRLVDGDLVPLDGAKATLAEGADPAQVSFSPDGRTLVITERGTDSITSFDVSPAGGLGMAKTIASSGPTPYGFAFASTGALIVTEAFRAEKGAAAASSYRLSDGSIVPVTASVGNGRSEICWAVVTPDDRHVFTTNFADGAISRYAVANDGSLTLEDATAGITTDGQSGLRDEDLTADGRFIYAVDADQGRVVGWSVGSGGDLTWLGAWDGLPLTIAGLAAA
jgi:6-phosphogluconolactonase (cycloisomerase 2 family)